MIAMINIADKPDVIEDLMPTFKCDAITSTIGFIPSPMVLYFGVTKTTTKTVTRPTERSAFCGGPQGGES